MDFKEPPVSTDGNARENSAESKRIGKGPQALTFFIDGTLLTPFIK
jgi:hypothetical protein